MRAATTNLIAGAHQLPHGRGKIAQIRLVRVALNVAAKLCQPDFLRLVTRLLFDGQVCLLRGKSRGAGMLMWELIHRGMIEGRRPSWSGLFKKQQEQQSGGGATVEKAGRPG